MICILLLSHFTSESVYGSGSSPFFFLLLMGPYKHKNRTRLFFFFFYFHTKVETNNQPSMWSPIHVFRVIFYYLRWLLSSRWVLRLPSISMNHTSVPRPSFCRVRFPKVTSVPRFTWEGRKILCTSKIVWIYIFSFHMNDRSYLLNLWWDLLFIWEERLYIYRILRVPNNFLKRKKYTFIIPKEYLL